MTKDCCSQDCCGSEKCSCVTEQKINNGGDKKLGDPRFPGDVGFDFAPTVRPARPSSAPIDELASPEEIDRLKQAADRALRWLENSASQCNNPARISQALAGLTAYQTEETDRNLTLAAIALADLFVEENNLPEGTRADELMSQNLLEQAVGWLIQRISREKNEDVLRRIAKFIRTYGQQTDIDKLRRIYVEDKNGDGPAIVLHHLGEKLPPLPLPQVNI